MSEAIYLKDPDGLDVEVYVDRDIRFWPMKNGEIVLDTKPVNLRTLLASSSGTWKGMPVGTTMGHVHLYVDDLLRAETFYRSSLGFSLKTWTFPGALFVGAGPYHHHVGLNTWAADSPIADSHDPRLLFWELILPSKQDYGKLMKRMAETGWGVTGEHPLTYTDPWGISVAIGYEDSASEDELRAKQVLQQ